MRQQKQMLKAALAMTNIAILSERLIKPKRKRLLFKNKLAKARKIRTSPSTLGLKKFGLGKLWVKKVFSGQKHFSGQKRFGSKKFWGQKSFWVKKVFG